MTITSTTNRNEYPGAGSVGPFAYTFRVFAATDLRVIRRSSAGVETVLTNVTHYTVAGVGDATGTVTLVTALAVGETLVIRRVLPIKQETSIRNQSSYFPGSRDHTGLILTRVSLRLTPALQSPPPRLLSPRLCTLDAAVVTVAVFVTSLGVRKPNPANIVEFVVEVSEKLARKLATLSMVVEAFLALRSPLRSVPPFGFRRFRHRTETMIRKCDNGDHDNCYPPPVVTRPSQCWH